MADKDLRVSILLQPGRYIVEVHDDGIWQAHRLQEADGKPSGALRFPAVITYLERHRRRVAALKATLRETE
jgi:hypothetical protein